MEQFEQLLTCCVCLDRYRNPKLLPCQHSFCMEPCMDGLVDYVRRQVKCPECRAEHRIPYQGVQGFPTNVTLQRFLELHIEITGELPDPTSGQTMERCNVCSEKNYCTLCVHCEKKICPDCKSAHMDILRREIVRINNQIRRGIHRLQDTLALVEKNMQNLSTNCNCVTEEIDEMNKRLFKALRDRTDYLKGEVDRYVTTEMKNLRTLKENLELEISNIQSNCDLADKHMTDTVEWDDCELVDTKEIFLKTVEFMRNFEYETSDYNRRVRFTMALDPNQLVMNVANYGDLNIIHPTPTSGTSGLLQAPVGPGLLRSKSDHRLATQFRQQEAQGLLNDDEPLLGGRKFGERPVKTASHADSRYGRGNDYGGDYGDYDNDSTSSRPKSRFRSRFVRGHQGDGDSDNESARNVDVSQSQKDKNKITSTEDTSKGPLSGIFRLMDSPRVMKRLQDQERGALQKKVTPPPQPAAPAAVPKQPTTQPPVTQKKTTARQMSEDEIDRIKRQNKGASSSTAAATGVTEPERPTTDRVSALKRQPSTSTDTGDTTTQNTATEQALFNDINEGDESSDSCSNLHNSSYQQSTTTPGVKTSAATPAKQVTRAPSNESSASSDSATGHGAATTTTTAANGTQEKKPFQSRFLNQPLTVEPPKVEETETSSEEESSDEETESEEESEEETKPTPATTTTTTTRPTSTTTTRTQDAKPETSSYRTRSSQVQDEARSDSRKNSREEPRSTYGQAASNSYKLSPNHSSFERDESPKYGRVRGSATTATVPEPEPESRYGSGYSSRFLNKSKSSAIVPPDDEKDEDSDSRYGTGRQRYMALKERRTRLARSRSSHNFGNDDDDDDPPSPTTVSPAAYLASRYGPTSALGSSGGSELARSRSTHVLKSRENSPERGATGSSASGGKDGAELSSWARYLKNKYGTRSRESKDTPSASSTSDRHGSSSTTAVTPTSTARRLSLGLPLRQANDFSSDDDSKNAQGSPTSPTVVAAIAGLAGLSPRAHYLQKRRQLFQIGGRGAEPGSFTWPRGIAVGADNAIVVADSSNHRVQVFDENGIFQKEFGQYGNSDGEFDCLAGIAVNRIGQYIIADRYNHRIQVLDPAGRFVRAFGSQGTSDGKFNYPWGISCDQLGFIYVCDKENHRIQVFQSDGTFVGKFGTCGNKEGQLEHPHYIAVSNNNRVIVSDSNNHRIQIFDINGRVLSSFGTEGSEEGQFKFPRGVAVDEHGFIVVADSGNNRIQIFHPDGSFLRAFGSWGSGDAEFKGLEGVAIMTNGSILVCDRENHRVQVF